MAAGSNGKQPARYGECTVSATHRIIAIAAVALSAISISGDSLQIDSQLPAATVNILMALVLLAVFGFTGSSNRSARG